MTRDVLLSIHPEHARAILDGSKPWEYRTVAPAQDPPYRVILYATDPIQAAIGEAAVDRVVEGDVYRLMNLTTPFPEFDARSLIDYIGEDGEGYALHMEDPIPWEAIPRADFEDAGVAPSQNFRYIDGLPP